MGSNLGQDVLAAVITIVVGAIVGVVADRLYERFRAGPGDYELWLHTRSRNLVSPDNARIAKGLRHSYDGVAVDQPVAVDVSIWNAGLKDIRADMFDGGLPLEVSLGSRIIGELHGSRGLDADTASISHDPTGTIKIGPSLLKRGMAKRYRFLVDGVPELTWTNRVADLALYDLQRELVEPTRGRTVAKSLAVLLFVLAGLFVLALMLGGLLLPVDARLAVGDVIERAGPWFLAPALFVPIGMGLLTFADSPSRRASAARRALKRSLASSPDPTSPSLGGSELS